MVRQPGNHGGTPLTSVSVSSDKGLFSLTWGPRRYWWKVFGLDEGRPNLGVDSVAYCSAANGRQ